MASENLQGSYDFFKIILKENLPKNKLELPKKFARLHGECLPDSVYLRPPHGHEWRVRVAKRIGGVSLVQGWPEFANHFSLSHGHLIFFRYRGNGVFKVSICDVTACQIHYNSQPLVNGDLKLENSIETETDVLVRRLDALSDCNESDEEDQPPRCSNKRKRATIASKDLNHSKSETRDKLAKFQSGDQAGSKRGKGRPKNETWNNTKAFAESKTFASAYPFFRAFISKGRNRVLHLQASFGRSYFEEKSQTVTLRSGNRSWLVRLVVCSSRYFLSGGFVKFVEENSLLPGDACVYELIKRNDAVLRVSFFQNKG